LEETLNANYPNYTHIHTDGSKMRESRVRVVTPSENKEIRLARPFFLIFNAEAEAINKAISITRNTIQPKRVRLTHSPGGDNDKPNPPKEHIILMWVPGHAGIQGN
jgi:hypothetical protein